MTSIWGSSVINTALASLRDDHPSVPYNPLLGESLYLARYIERVGSGTQTMIEICREAGLPEPQLPDKLTSIREKPIGRQHAQHRKHF